jgi:hypothetical protein
MNAEALALALTAASFACDACAACKWETEPGDQWIYCGVCGHAMPPADAVEVINKEPPPAGSGP